MLKISESLYEVPMAEKAHPEEVAKLTEAILRGYRARKAASRPAQSVPEATADAPSFQTPK
jgi:hypothetical protein